jgi:hypothetical protein
MHGCPILRVVCEGWDTKILRHTVAYPTLEPNKGVQGWGTRRFVALTTVPNKTL